MAEETARTEKKENEDISSWKMQVTSIRRRLLFFASKNKKQSK